MKGKRASISGKKVDLILVAACYLPGAAELSFVQGYERRGSVWSDIVLLERDELIAHLESGLRVVTGRLADLVGDFEIIASIGLEKANGSVRLLAQGRDGTGDDLGLPLF